MVLDDMCVLMSVTTLNSCKLAVYEGEVLQKSTTFLSFAPSGEEKKKKNDDRACDCAGPALRRDLGQASHTD